MNKIVNLITVFFCCAVLSAAWAAPHYLYGKTYKMNVDREAKHPQVGVPFVQLNENHYTKLTSAEIRYTVSISKSGEKVTIEGGEKIMTGERYKTENNLIYYQLTNGVVAGGKLIIWKEKGVINAELTIYGSGFPIIASERGILIFK